jgi:hypothetical protein
MKTLRNVLLSVLLATPLATLAEDAPAAKEEAPKVVFSGLVDAYYTANLTQAQEVVNPLRAYDGVTGFNLNWAKLGASMAAAPAGFKIDLGFGPESYYATNFFVLQGYASLKLGPGVLDFGQFTTSAGFELFESNLNWLYSRGFIYTFIVPTFHQGARYTMNLTEQLQLQGSISNGWENGYKGIVDRSGLFYPDEGFVNTLSPRKTGHLSLFYAGEGLTGAATVYYGKQPGAQDTLLLLDGNVGVALGALEANLSAAYRVNGDAKIYGVNLSSRYALMEALKVAARVEYMKSDDGSGTDTAENDATNVTLGLVHPVGANAEIRAEFRYDMASDKIFAKTLADDAEVADNAMTGTLAVMGWF